MYDELVRRLREDVPKAISNFDYDFVEDWIKVKRSIKEAADAIEELSKLADAIPHVCECCIGCEMERKNGGCDNAFVLSPKRAMQYLIKPRWIPVNEQLPESVCKSYLCLTDTGYHCEVRWTNNIFGFGESDRWGWSIADVPQYCKVTNWMPLPQPPKEET